MHKLPCLLLLLGLAMPGLRVGPAVAADAVLAPTGTLRAAYIVSNLAQASRDAATGTYRGVSTDIATELGRRGGVPVAILPADTAAAVLLAVRSGAADIGFVAPNPDRLGVVLYSQTYMLVQQSFLVRDGSPIRSVGDLDAPGQVIGANAGDSVSVYLRQHLRRAQLLESPDYTLRQAAAWLAEGTVVAFAGNRQRLHVSTQGIPGLHLLPDNLYGVPQAVAVARERPDLLSLLNAALDEMQSSGFLARAVAASGVDGIDVAPPAP